MTLARGEKEKRPHMGDGLKFKVESTPKTLKQTMVQLNQFVDFLFSVVLGEKGRRPDFVNLL
jgi:hypothetical protein